MSRTGRHYGHFVITGLLALTAVLAAACGSGNGGAPAQGSSSPGSGSSGSGLSAPAATVATTGAGTPADAGTKAAITTAFKYFFDYQSTAAQSTDALQDGNRFTAVLAQQGTQSYAQKSSATVQTARLLSPNTAKVVFTVFVGGQPLLADAPGYAVRIGGSWKVAATTFCNLLALQGDKVDACKDPAVTALPK